MMKKYLFFIPVVIFLISSCGPVGKQKTKVRGLTDTVGYAHTALQMDSIMARITRLQNKEYRNHLKFKDAGPAKAVVCPHDDYAYVGNLYPATLQNIQAKTVILFGVAHKAKRLHLENQIIFDSYDYWKGPYGKVKVSDLREKIMDALPTEMFQVNDSMQSIEHSVEAIIPFLQYFNRNVQIVSILVPYMSYDQMVQISVKLASAIDLKQLHDKSPLRSRVIGYTSSLVDRPLPVKDMGMDVTAPAYDHHWVGYAAIRYD